MLINTANEGFNQLVTICGYMFIALFVGSIIGSIVGALRERKRHRYDVIYTTGKTFYKKDHRND